LATPAGAASGVAAAQPQPAGGGAGAAVGTPQPAGQAAAGATPTNAGATVTSTLTTPAADTNLAQSDGDPEVSPPSAKVRSHKRGGGRGATAGRNPKMEMSTDADDSDANGEGGDDAKPVSLSSLLPYTVSLVAEPRGGGRGVV
jgi:hypothetical protein